MAGRVAGCDTTRREKTLPSGGHKMETRFRNLTDSGFQLVWAAGDYCQACRDERDFILRWDGEHWVVQ